MISLKRRVVDVSAPRALCFEVVASAGRVVEQLNERERIVEFTTDVRGRPVVTKERLFLDEPRSITYEWLEGPLPHARERISFLERGSRKSALVYEGAFSPRPGLLGGMMGHLWARPLFNRLVIDHLEEARAIAERRAERSRKYGAQSSDQEQEQQTR